MDASNGLESFEETSGGDIKSFFASSPPLKDAAEINRKIEEFVQQNSLSDKARRIVLVTSGGTTVPLEQRCVRYILILIISAQVIEELLQQIRRPYEKSIKEAIGNSHAATTCGTLLKIPFTTIFEYLQILQLIASSMSTLGSNALFYLAAAVSDFYVPWESMAEHKIQSSSGPLDMRLAQVPKMLSVLRKDWAPNAFCISFKLETDKKILLEKAGNALKKYNMDMVVANELLTRKEEVIVVTKNGSTVVQLDKTRADADVEEPLWIGILLT